MIPVCFDQFKCDEASTAERLKTVLQVVEQIILFSFVVVNKFNRFVICLNANKH
jgi:hypothetical protein